MEFDRLQNEIERLIETLEKRGLLSTDKIKTDEFLNVINNSFYLITVHDVEFYRPICLNNKMRDFYGFKRNYLSHLDHVYYLRTIHTSTYAALVESVSFFRNQQKEYLNLTYKLSYQKKEWKIVRGTTKTILKNKRAKDKYAITLAEEKSGVSDKMSENMLQQLTSRELIIAELLTKGLSRKEIATELFVSEHTVHSHIKNTYRKLDIHKVSELIHIVRKYAV